MTGCVEGDPAGGSDSPQNLATYVPSGDGGNAGLLEAHIDATEPCVSVRDAAGNRYVPVFPETAVSYEEGVARYSGVELIASASLDLPGGVVTKLPEGGSAPDGCDGEYWLVNAED